MTTFNEFDQFNEAKKFDDSKTGVKGLLDSGLTTIPRIFIHPPETLSGINPVNRKPGSDHVIPTIDLSGVHSGDRRSTIVEEISRASRELGFFQIVNHGVPVEVLDKVINGVKAFHELPTEVKKRWYRRDMVNGVNFFSNVDLFKSKAASWRDTLQIRLGSNLAEIPEIPEVCREEVMDWSEEAVQVAELLMELLCEGLAVKSSTLKEMSCLEGRVMVGHYYPHCPQPDLTVGITSHTDPGVLTLLLQDSIGGLQVRHGDEWVDVTPVPGAIVVNIGDILQIMSNDEYKSVDHRVLANPSHDPRVSIAIFFNPGKRDCQYGPLPDLISPEKPAIYKQFTLVDYMKKFFSKELDGKGLTGYFKL
ncbi:1-aminocyclopropane-1-carboxylate oxidase homolog 4-like [Mercurialis annua]|uniref:1-aminocyclopropane-1-carboxylate oxidase homolog 4-like n=1 Tax=Mercurialis annua TaxID=3986 RepID=UPI00215EAE06|nr:1-aminocyclopropane-1-carboxylate oxidase homolog 4-like [Mercurialis annua]